MFKFWCVVGSRAMVLWRKVAMDAEASSRATAHAQKIARGSRELVLWCEYFGLKICLSPNTPLSYLSNNTSSQVHVPLVTFVVSRTVYFSQILLRVGSPR